MVLSVQSFNDCVAAIKNRSSTARARAQNTLDKISRLLAQFERLNPKFLASVRVLKGAWMQSRITSGRSLVQPCQRVRAQSSRPYAMCITFSLSMRLLMRSVRLLGLV